MKPFVLWEGGVSGLGIYRIQGSTEAGKGKKKCRGVGHFLSFSDSEHDAGCDNRVVRSQRWQLRWEEARETSALLCVGAAGLGVPCFGTAQQALPKLWGSSLQLVCGSPGTSRLF